MGAACCVSAKDRTIVHAPSGGALQRHVRYSPSWSVRWDNRGRVAGEDTHANWLHDRGVRNDQVEVKSGTTIGTAFASEEGSSLDNLRSRSQKSPVSNGNEDISKIQVSDEAVSRNLVEVKESAGSPSVPHPAPVKLSPLAASATSPLTKQNQLLRSDMTPSRCHRYSREPQFLHQVPASQIPEYKSPAFSISEGASSHLPPDWGSESTRGSNGGSSDSWSIPVFSELMTTRRERWSFDSDNSGVSVDKIARSSCRSSGSPSVDLQTCGVCAKLLTERSLWGWSNQKIVSTNELAVVSILTCGHVYHAECLEYMTPEINKYDPACPVCTYGGKQAVKMCEKALKAELDIKARKRSRKRIVDGDLKTNVSFDHDEHGGAEGKGSKVSSSIIKKSSLGKPFLKRHFSFSSKSGKSLPENQFARRKGIFWARSSKE
ncbi:hypothetical protein C2S52_018176 [Perilla frutescens var. hirtella]|nr:hypothetical protein C2S52_018176 [Perilla frutescens var. hirtella]